jgi:ParB family chromosome partitioning protein
MTKQHLGKGLEALIPKNIFSNVSVTNIEITQLQPNSRQPRLFFNEKTLDELADSIKQHGIAQPILVRKINGNYEIVAGQRRFEAAKKAEFQTVPCIIKDISDRSALEIALIENLQREDLNPLDEAEAFKRLQNEFGLNQTEIAKAVGKDRATISNSIRLLALPQEIKQFIREDKISEGHARVILAEENQQKQIQLALKAVKDSLSVRDLEDIVYQRKTSVSRETLAHKYPKDPELRRLQDELTQKLATKVLIRGTQKRGTITVSYFSQEDLERILGIILE